MILESLQNGSDIRGVATATEDGEQVNLTPETAAMLTYGFVKFLEEKTDKPASELTVSVGCDPRLSSPQLDQAVIAELAKMGVTVCDCGLASTPAMFMTTVFPDFLCDGAVMVTASHLPYNRNGLKFFTKDGGVEKADITRIIKIAEETYGDSLQERPAAVHVVQRSLLTRYSEHLRKMIIETIGADKPLSGLKIAVDAGNGSGGFYASDVLAPLGADVSSSQFLDPDGRFPNHIPNPENSDAMHSICEAVVKGGCNLGIIFDTDVDRSSAVDASGREISKNAIVALAAALICDDNPGTTIVTDSVTSEELTEFLERDLGVIHRRFRRGYRNVINEAVRLNREGRDCELAIETSGHAAFRENYFLDDGAYLATKIVIKAAQLHRQGKDIGSLIAKLKHPKEALELRLPIVSADFSAYGDMVLGKLSQFVLEDNYFISSRESFEGVRCMDIDSTGWFLLRKSLHDPIMPLNIESKLEGGSKLIAKRLYDFLKRFDGLDLKPLIRACGGSRADF